jgi:hypothetical protein
VKKKILKIAAVIAVISLVGVLFGSLGKNDATVILDNSDKSYFVDFYTEGDKVYIECVLNIYANKDTEVSISATDTDNVKIGLLDSPTLTGIDKSDNNKNFDLKAGENEVTVLFEGDYAGIFQIYEREIPRFIEVY